MFGKSAKVFLWGLWVFLGAHGAAHAAPGAMGQLSLLDGAQKLSLQTPMLGDSRRASQNVLGDLSLGVLEQAQSNPSLDATITAILVIAGIVFVGWLVLTIGNIYALASHKGRLGWGIAGIVLGGLGLLWNFVNIALFAGQPANPSTDGATIAGLVLNFIMYGSLLTLGILNVMWHRKRRGYRRYGQNTPEVMVAPYVHVGQQKTVEGGGLSFVGRF